MYLWGIRVTTYLTNSLVLIGYALLFNWLQDTHLAHLRQRRLREGYLIALTSAFLLLFHYASVFSIWQERNAIGFGWTYISFQVATVLYALLSTRTRTLFYSLGVILLVWYWWLPHVPDWPLLLVVSVALMLVAQRFGVWIGSRAWRYYPFCLAFAAPFTLANWQSLRGIDVGWLWEVSTYIGLCALLWAVHYMVQRQHRRDARLRHEARVDELTQLNNFRVFTEDLQTVYARSQATGDVFALFTFDIDHFKQVNDRYGHLVGNRVLQTVAKRLQAIATALPYADVRCYRTGGEEFSFILPKIVPSFTIGQNIAWQVHDELGRLQFVAEDGSLFQISISLGEDRSRPEDQNYLDVYNRADQYLYASKNSGRNTITVNGTTLPQRPRP